tara:strand:+ start:331 stop:1080 length:750 start_codon:yes stop_codon:yes gene_type:complete
MCFIAESGHPSSSLSCSDIIGSLYFDVMDHKIDKFILSKGHAAPCLYSALIVNGDIPYELISELRKVNSPLQGHPDFGRLPNVNMTSGALGQGVSFAIGCALAKKIKSKDGYIFALIGDGEMQEGQIWESAMFAGNNKLNNLIVFLDNNGGQSDGYVKDILPIDPILEKWKSFNWVVKEIDGHNVEEIKVQISEFKGSHIDKPLMVVANTKKGFINNELTILDGKHGGVVDEDVLKEVENAIKKDIEIL